jgi:Tol biopolymer transport system component
LRKNPERRFQVMIDVKIALEEIKEEAESGRLAAGSQVPAKNSAGPRIFWVFAAMLTLLAAALSGFWWIGKRNGPAQGPILTRITSDSGLTTEPAISPDGKLVAYASDRAGRGDLDIWVQQAAGGSPIRVTSEEADEHEPAFSPDGAAIAFRSEREGGGVYVVPALGGQARLVAKGGHDPRFSPDGSQIAYWTGAGVTASTPSQIYIVPAAGGASREAQSALKYARHPLWTADGKHLLFWGMSERGSDWWVVDLPVEGASQPARSLVRTEMPRTAIRQDIRDPLYPWCWLNEQVVFTAPLGDSTDLWSVPVSHRNWHVTGPPRRLSVGVELVKHPSTAAGSLLVFAGLRSEVNVWSLAVDANSGKVTGGLEQLTHGLAPKDRPVLSRNGSKLAFGLVGSGQDMGGAIVVKDLATAKETQIAPVGSWYPSLNHDGTRIAYARLSKERKFSIYVASSSGDVPEKVCDDCGLTPAAWSSDNGKLLYDFGAPQFVGLFDLAARKKIELLRLPGRAVTQASFSPDDRWICFLAGVGPGRTRVHIIPFRQGSPVPPETEWIAVTSGSAFEALPRWSPNGNLVYFISDRDGFRCLWAQRVDPVTKKPVVAPFAVSHFHQARRSFTNVVSIGLVGLGVSRDRLVFNLGELTGNIWMEQLVGPN